MYTLSRIQNIMEGRTAVSIPAQPTFWQDFKRRMTYIFCCGANVSRVEPDFSDISEPPKRFPDWLPKEYNKRYMDNKERLYRAAYENVCPTHYITLERDRRGELIPIGSGRHGTVFLARYTPTGKFVAVKMFRGNRSVKNIRREAAMLDILQGTKLCPKFYGLLDMKDRSPGKFSNLAVVMELVRFKENTKQCFNLKTYVQTTYERDGLTTKDWRSFCRELADGIKEIHELGACVLDIMDENVMVTRDSQGAIHPRLVDLGGALFLDDDTPIIPPHKFNSRQLKSMMKKRRNAAVEMFDSSIPTAKMDVYSLGVLFNDIGKIERILDLTELSLWCTTRNPSLRPSIFGVLKELGSKESSV